MRQAIVRVFVLTVIAVTASAQGKPDFSGKWTRDGGSGTTAFVAGGFNCGGTCDITVNGNMITLTRAPNTDRPSGTSDRVATLNMAGDATYKANSAAGQVELTTTGQWQGNKLLFTTMTRDAAGKPFTLLHTVSLEGAKLIVASNAASNVTYTQAVH